MNNFKIMLLIIPVAIAGTRPTYAQENSPYFVSYATLLTGRFYFSQKFTSFKYRNTKEHYTLNYQPNTNLNIGLGVSYKWATLNLAYGFGFLNPDGDKGKTDYLDLQFHEFGRKNTIDLLGQFYSGFYLSPKGESTTPDRYYIRPDLKVNIVGGSFQHVFNYRRFSLRAASLQTEWQKKSAGSILAGLEAYGGQVKADSTLTPVAVNKNAANLSETRIRFFEFGPNIGYAYTLVVQENFFLTGSASVSLDYGVNTLTTKDGDIDAHGLSSNVFSRLIIGYNSAKWAFSAIYFNNGVHLVGSNNNQQIILNTGSVRICFVHRFMPGSEEKKLLKGIN